MKNPFLDFKGVSVTNKDIPLGQIVRRNQQVLDGLLSAYQCLEKDTVKEFCRLLNHGLRLNLYKAWLSGMEMPKLFAATLANASTVYESCLRLIQPIEYAPNDIEELCAVTGLSREADFEQSGPMGLFISALINRSEAARFELNLHQQYTRLHFLGFRLEAGKHLTVHGDPGHFSGAGLQGGTLEVNGSTGSWCGAGMISGCIKITGDALSKTGERMRGGQIQVDGRILQIAKSRFGGDILSNAESE
jgi:formylmethanofuran dehydrogenase subunit C